MKSRAAIHQLKTVWGKVGLDHVPAADETSNSLKISKLSKRQKSDRTAQMNLRIRPQEKQRVAMIAVRERVSINEIFSRMLEVYEREYGRTPVVPTRTLLNK